MIVRSVPVPSMECDSILQSEINGETGNQVHLYDSKMISIKELFCIRGTVKFPEYILIPNLGAQRIQLVLFHYQEQWIRPGGG